MRILVSACLLGIRCRYDGQCRKHDGALALSARNILIPVCPEQLGGLPTPRLPAEIQAGRVIRQDGQDITAAYERGAQEALRLYRLCACDMAVLKSKSPSCGTGRIHDGSFSGQLTAGDGVTATLFRQSGIPIATEEDLSDPEKIQHLLIR